MTNLGGRPTSYSEEMEEKALEYIEKGYESQGEVIPSAMGMAKYLNVAESTIYKWVEDERGTFSETLAKCKSEQHRILINKGLTNEFSGTITKLALSNHGYSEKTQTDVTSGGKPIQNEWHLHPTDGED